MALNTTLVLSALTAYVDQIGEPNLITESVFSSRTAKLVRVQKGVKGQQALNIYTTTQNWQPAACGLISPTGSQALTQTVIATNDMMSQMAICMVGANSLSKYWTGVLMPKGINQEEPTPKQFAEAMIHEEILKSGDFCENISWQGNTGTQSFSSGIGNMSLTNGFLYQLYFGTGASSIISTTYSWTGGTTPALLTPTNAISTIQGMIGALPQAIADKELMVFCGLANYRTIVNALLDKQTFNETFYVIDNGGNKIPWAFHWPYTFNVTVVAVGGLQGRKDLVLTMPENLVLGVDGEHDEEEFRVWYDPTYNSIFGRTMVRLGTAIPQPQYVVWEPGGYN